MGTLRKRNEKWYIDFYSNGKRYKQCIGKDKKIAQQVLNKKLTEIAEGKFLDKRISSTLTFKEFTELYMDLYAKPNKLSWKNCDLVRIRNLNPVFGKYNLDVISPTQIEEYKKQRLTEVSPATVNREITCMKHLYNKANEWGKTDKNPARLTRKLREDNSRLRYLDEDEISRLIDNTTGYMRSIIILAVNTGMRRGEILGIKWDDIDFTLGLIYLLRTKNGERRNVPMNNNVIEALKHVPKIAGSDYLFMKINGNPIINLAKRFPKLLKELNITDFRFHDLRHTFASRLAMKGIDLNMIRALLGHKSINMTLRYSHLSPSHMKNAVGILSF